MRRHDTGFVGSTAHGLVGGSTGGIDVGDAERPAGDVGRHGALGRAHGTIGDVVEPGLTAGVVVGDRQRGREAGGDTGAVADRLLLVPRVGTEIGRASCRERVCQYV